MGEGSSDSRRNNRGCVNSVHNGERELKKPENLLTSYLYRPPDDEGEGKGEKRSGRVGDRPPYSRPLQHPARARQRACCTAQNHRSHRAAPNHCSQVWRLLLIALRCLKIMFCNSQFQVCVNRTWLLQLCSALCAFSTAAKNRE